jgi:hypothetical protein
MLTCYEACRVGVQCDFDSTVSVRANLVRSITSVNTALLLGIEVELCNAGVMPDVGGDGEKRAAPSDLRHVVE